MSGQWVWSSVWCVSAVGGVQCVVCQGSMWGPVCGVSGKSVVSSVWCVKAVGGVQCVMSQGSGWGPVCGVLEPWAGSSFGGPVV